MPPQAAEASAPREAVIVDGHDTAVELLCHGLPKVGVSSPHGGGEPEGGGVDPLLELIHVIEARDGQDRSEGLLDHHGRVGGDIRQYRRCMVEALSAGLAPADDRRASSHGVGHVPLHRVQLGLGDEWTDVDTLAEGLGLGLHARDEVIEDRGVNVASLDCGTVFVPRSRRPPR